MAIILAIDTATPACSAAISCDGIVVSDYVLELQSHTRLILPMVDVLVKKLGIELAQIDAITFTHGPGSFTGIRIGFGVVQGLALGLGVPVIAVSTLELMALTAKRKLALAGGTFIYPVLDARMSELYCGQYQIQQNKLIPLEADQLVAIDNAFVSQSLNTPSMGVGDGWKLIPQPEQFVEQHVPDFYPEAEDLLALAEAQFLAGKAKAIAGLEPLYIRDTVSWKKRQRLRKEA